MSNNDNKKQELSPGLNRLLTPLELKVMKVLWRKGKAFVKEILDEWDDEPKPAYNTVSTIVRILQDKQFVNYISYGRTYEYLPTITESDYQRDFLKNAIQHVFSGSMSSLLSTLVDDEKISAQEIEELKRIVEAHES